MDDDTSVSGRMGAVLLHPPALDEPTHAAWGTMVARQHGGIQHDPEETDVHVLIYYEPQVLAFDTPTVSVPRESAFAATEPCLLRLSRNGVDGAGSGPHLTLFSVRRPGVVLHTLHKSCVGPMTPFHVYFGEQNGMRPIPDTAYVVLHGNYLRRGLTIRFPPGVGEYLIPLCNKFLTFNIEANLIRHPRPVMLDIHALNANPSGFTV